MCRECRASINLTLQTQMLRLDRPWFLKAGHIVTSFVRKYPRYRSIARCQLASRRYCAITPIYRVVRRIIIFGYCRNYRAHTTRSRNRAKCSAIRYPVLHFQREFSVKYDRDNNLLIDWEKLRKSDEIAFNLYIVTNIFIIPVKLPRLMHDRWNDRRN